MPITPALPAQQHDAIARLKYGRATKTLLQFSQPLLARAGTAARVRLAAALRRRLGRRTRSSAGAPASSALLAGGSASDATQAIVAKARRARAGAARSTGSARTAAELTASRQVVWEQDPCARGGYAYFDPAFDPALRAWLARPCRPIVLRRRAHQHQVAGLHERRGGKRTPRRGRSRRDAYAGIDTIVASTLPLADAVESLG